MNRLSFRSAYLLGFVVCAALIGFALYSQFQWGLQPCPLCIFQRIAFAALGQAVVVAVVLLRFPETAHRSLEELNPEDAGSPLR